MGAQAVRLSNVDIDNALKNKDFEVLFQPIFDLGNGALARVETFVRWRHPSLGVLPPGAFISFFESQGRMSELTRYVLAQALAQYRDWRGASAPGFSINLALSDLTDEAFSSHFAVLLRDSGFPADLITLECPMPPVTMEVTSAGEHFSRLAQTGARLAIEVRGRANDFLRQIEPFPFDEIKTGGAAILRFARTVRGPGLSAISELLDIANKSNAAITAVGVEDQASLSALRGLGFAAAQGNHLGKVGPLSSFSADKVNEVRGLLGLPPLDAAELAAMFRTEAPAPKPSKSPKPAAPVAEEPPDEDALVERLAARLAQRQIDDGAREAPTPEPVAADASLKAAAIAKARRKAKAPADTVKPEVQPDAPPLVDEAAAADVAPARSLQERLSRAFDADDLDDIPEFDESDGGDVDFASLLDIAQETPPQNSAAAAASLDFDLDPSEMRFDPADNLDGLVLGDAGKASAATPPPPVEQPSPPSPPARPPALATASYRPVSPDGATRAALAIKGARAHFRPGLRVGVSQSKAPPVAAPAPGPVPPQTPAATAAPAETVVLDDTPPVGRGIPQADPQPAEEPAPTLAAARGGTQRPRLRRRKSFLSRTVIPYPTHFWPRSWKRAWKRRGSAQRRREATDSLAAE